MHHPLVSLSTTRELCAFAGAQDVVRGHIELFGMLLYVYSEGVETIIRKVFLMQNSELYFHGYIWALEVSKSIYEYNTETVILRRLF